MQLGSRVAVAVVWTSSYSSDLTPNLGTSVHCGCGTPPKKKDRKKERKKKRKSVWKASNILKNEMFFFFSFYGHTCGIWKFLG